MFPHSTTETVADMALKAAPPVAVTTATVMGYTIPEWVQFLTLVYVTLMVVHKLWTMGREAYRFWFLGDRGGPVDEV